MRVMTAILGAMVLFAAGSPAWADDKKAESQTVHNFTVQAIDGKEVDLSTYKDHVLLIVNVASK